jgi:hypothetical protein
VFARIYDRPARDRVPERNGIVEQVSDAKRDRVYCARALLDTLEEPAHQSPTNAT